MAPRRASRRGGAAISRGRGLGAAADRETATLPEGLILMMSLISGRED